MSNSDTYQKVELIVRIIFMIGVLVYIFFVMFKY